MGFEDELDTQYNFAGMILPIDEEFYEEEDISDLDFILVRQHPFSLLGHNQWYKVAQTQETVGNSTCFIDALLYPINYMAYTQSISRFSDGMRPKCMKYWGCRDCKSRKGHCCFPWQPFIPGLPSRYNIGGNRTTWTTLMDEWRNQATENRYIQKLLGYYYVSMFVMAQKIMLHCPNEEIKTELCNANHRIPTRSRVLGYFKITDVYLKCNDAEEHGYDFEQCNKDPTTDLISSHHQNLISFKKRPLYVRMTSEIGIPFPTNEGEFFIKSANNRGNATGKTLFVSQTDLDKLPIHQVKHFLTSFIYHLFPQVVFILSFVSTGCLYFIIFLTSRCLDFIIFFPQGVSILSFF